MIKRLAFFFKHPNARAVGIVFSINSILFGSWITRLPEIKSELSLSEAELGFTLLGLPIGSLAFMPVIGWLIHRLGAGKATVILTVAFCISVLPPVLANSAMALFLSFLVLGIFTGSMDIAMNAAAAATEKNDRVAIMSTCHGMFSVGGMVGAGTASLIVGIGISKLVHIGFVALLMIILTAVLTPRLLKIKDISAGAVFALPTKPLLILSIIGFGVLLGEGAIADWSAIFIKDTLNGSAYISGFGFAGFSLTMALGRFYGDSIIPRWGAQKTILIGSTIASLGVGFGIIFLHPYAAILGFTIAGIGYSCIVPALFGAAAKAPGLAPGTSLAAVATVGYFGFLLGPPAIGLLADNFGLQTGLGLVVVLAGISAILSFTTRSTY